MAEKTLSVVLAVKRQRLAGNGASFSLSQQRVQRDLVVMTRSRYYRQAMCSLPGARRNVTGTVCISDNLPKLVLTWRWFRLSPLVQTRKEMRPCDSRKAWLSGFYETAVECKGNPLCFC